jgi:hypothetical protein
VGFHCIPSLTATSFLPTYLGGGAGEQDGGKATVATKQTENPVMTKMHPFIIQLAASQTFKHFLDELNLFNS